MGELKLMLRTRLEQRVIETWRLLVQHVAAQRGIRGQNLEAFGWQLWAKEWAPRIDGRAYSADIEWRRAALRQVLYRDLMEEDRQRALALLTAPMWPTLFRQVVLTPQDREGWTIWLGAPPNPLPPGEVPAIPACYAHLVGAPPEMSQGENRWPGL